MPLAVIGAGLPRTGTFSLKHALEQLDYGRCHHMAEIFDHLTLARHWERVFDGEDVDWESVFEGYGATVDAPSCFVYRQLAARYPDAKVILTRRTDPEAWFKSMSATTMNPEFQAAMLESPLAPMMDKMRGFVMGSSGAAPPDPPPEGPPPAPDHDTLVALYEQHNAAVRATIPPERLLEFQVSEGWEPLCSFLGKAVPEAPFPRLNSTEEFVREFDPKKFGWRSS
jgi:hypothetical protein